MVAKPTGKIPNLGPQFMPITELQGLKANDMSSDMYHPLHKEFFNKEVPGLEHHWDVNVGQLSRNHPYYKYNESGNKPYDWHGLAQDVGEEGIHEPFHVQRAGSVFHTADPQGNPVPHVLPEDRLINGHHRAVIAQEQGHMFVPFTEKPKGGGTRLYRGDNGPTQNLPNRKWEPLIQEHEHEDLDSALDRKARTARATEGEMFGGQGSFFRDRRG